MSTIFLSQGIGILLIIIGLSFATERKMVMVIFEEFFNRRALTYMWGLITLAISIVLVLTHNIWSGTAEIAITILAWYLFFEALIYVFLPQKYLHNIFRWLQKKIVYYPVAFAFLLVGFYLFCSGFSIF